MSKHWPKAVEGRIATKNQFGFMFTDISGTSPAFIEDTRDATGLVLDIGCACGIVTLPVLKQSNCKVLAFDLSEEHLNALRLSVSEEEANRLTTICRRFPDDFRFKENSIDAIHISHLLHYLNGADTEKGLKSCFRALKHSGKLYINTSSIYFSIFKAFVPIYEANSVKGSKWPGEINDLQKYVPEHENRGQHSDNFHVHKIEDFKKLLLRLGFVVEDLFYYDLKGPAWFASGGKGLIGTIASKP